MPNHFLELANARSIRTPYFLATQLAVDEAIALHAMAAIHGEAGLGKTYAVTYAYERAPLNRCWVEFPANISTKQVVQELIHKITGARLTGTRYELQHQLLEILGEKDRLVVIDEAQRLNHECIEFLRFLHDDKDTTFTLLLVGGNGCWDVLSAEPMLASRIVSHVGFEPMTLEQVLVVIPAFHPLYQGVDPLVIEMVDDTCALGIFRNWVRFTVTAERLMARREASALSMDIAHQAMALL